MASGRLYGHGVTYRYWPLFDLRLSTPDLRLLRADWLASGLGDRVEITGFDACLPLFGLPGR